MSNSSIKKTKKTSEKKKKTEKKIKTSDKKKQYDDSKIDETNVDLKIFNQPATIESNYKKEKLTIGDYSIDQDELYAIGDAELDDKGLVHHHISSANDLYSNGIPQIITQVFKVEKDIANQRDSTPL